MRVKLLVSVVAIVMLGLIALTSGTAAEGTVDETLSASVTRYTPTLADQSYIGEAAGNTAAADVTAVGTALQYTGLILNGNGTSATANHIFLKVQSQSANGKFSNAACYLGNNGGGGSFGLGFFTLTTQFTRAHMSGSYSGGTVTLAFTNVDGGTLPNQTYVCTGAPAPVGDKIGVNGFANTTSTLDNFSDGTTVIDTFSFTGPLASSGNWADVAPGMNANGTVALGGPTAISFSTKVPGSCAATVAVSDVPDGKYILNTLYRFRDDVMLQSEFGSRYVDLFYKNTAEASSILMRSPVLRFRVAYMLWRQQSTLNAMIERRAVAIRTADLREIDSIIGGFMERASPALAADLRIVRQEVANRTILNSFGVRVND